MRVIAGTYKGHKLASPGSSSAVRPTLDSVREAVFNILGPIEGLRALDLFAGSGAFGIEALSRGASTVTFVDSDVSSIRTVGRNLEKLGIGPDRRNLIRIRAAQFLPGSARNDEPWDLVFCDPPYRFADEFAPELSRLLPPILAPGARIVCESSVKRPLQLALPVLTERRYGDTLIVVHEGPARAKGESDAPS